MNFKYSLAFILTFLLWATPQGHAQTLAPQSAAIDAVLDRVVVKEKEFVRTLSNYTPMVETYIQNLQPDPELGAVPTNDKYFLGKLDFKKGVNANSLLPAPGIAGTF